MPKSERKHSVIIALGGNLGDVPATFRHALETFAQRGIVSDISAAPLYKSKSLLRDGQNDYINTVLTGQTAHAPEELLRELKNTEREYGRTERGRWQARPLDLDIIDYGGLIINVPALSLPHPQMAARSFVLLPLRDLIPGYVHPATGRTIDDMIAALGDDLDITRL